MAPGHLSSLVLILIAGIVEISGHGRLIEPPSRASAWRYGFSTPPNYNDHELYCGGYSRQWLQNEGRCGVCGDAWDLPEPRPHEIGGAYGQGVIVRRYAIGALFNIRVELTANHNGYFEFRLCPKHTDSTQGCFDRYTLKLARINANDGDPLGYRFYPHDGNRIYEMRYKFPVGVSCQHCVLQWIYVAGNNWGTCPNGTGAIGCGSQEEFRACADISIGDGITDLEPESSTKLPTTTPTTIYHLPDEYMGTPVATLILVACTLFVVLILFGLLYAHYYCELGKRVKTWLKCKKIEPPIPPPRNRRIITTTTKPQIQNDCIA